MDAAPDGWHVYYVSRDRYLLNAPEGRESFQAGYYGRFEDEDEAFTAATHMNALVAVASAYTGGA